jgi:hypothetical protein
MGNSSTDDQKLLDRLNALKNSNIQLQPVK